MFFFLDWAHVLLVAHSVCVRHFKYCSFLGFFDDTCWPSWYWIYGADTQREKGLTKKKGYISRQQTSFYQGWFIRLHQSHVPTYTSLGTGDCNTNCNSFQVLGGSTQSRQTDVHVQMLTTAQMTCTGYGVGLCVAWMQKYKSAFRSIPHHALLNLIEEEYGCSLALDKGQNFVDTSHQCVKDNTEY